MSLADTVVDHVVDGLIDGLEVLREPDLRFGIGVGRRIQDGLEDADPVFHVGVGDDLPVGIGVVTLRREERRVGPERDQRAGHPERVPEIRREIGRVRDLIVGLDRRDETLGHHGVRLQGDVWRVQTVRRGIVGVGHGVIPHAV